MTYEASSMVAAERRRVRILSAVAVVAIVVGMPSSARADGDAAAAETLFQQGMSALDAGDYATACPKLADSARLDPASGTVLALALCHEREGKVASAWARYIDAAALARRDGRSDRESAALEQAKKLEPRLSRLTVRVAPATRSLGGVEIRHNGEPVPASALDTALPVDAGEHVIEARAPGHVPFRAVARVGSDGERAEIAVPALADEPPAPAPTPPPPAPRPIPEAPEAPTGGSGRLAVGLVVGGAGLVALGAGAFFGVRALDDAEESRSLCSSPRCANPRAISLNDDARTSSTIANVLVVGGALATVAGIYLVLSSPSDAPRRAASVRLSPFALEGTW